jgi:hypothetical protein
MGAKLKAFWAKVTSDVGDLWEKDKGFVIAFGIIILGVKFRDIMISLITSSGKAIFNKAQATDATLAKQEDSDKTSAESLEQQANQTTNPQSEVTEDWNKK